MKYQSPGCILRGSDVTGVDRGAEDCSERPSAAGLVHRPSVPALGAHSPGMASSPTLPSLPVTLSQEASSRHSLPPASVPRVTLCRWRWPV